MGNDPSSRTVWCSSPKPCATSAQTSASSQRSVESPSKDPPVTVRCRCAKCLISKVGVRPAGTAKRISESAKVGLGALAATEGTDQQEPMEAAKTNANVFASLDRSRGRACHVWTAHFLRAGSERCKRSTVNYGGSNCGCKGTWRPGFGKPDGLPRLR